MANKAGINGSPCSPPSPCWISWTVPSSSSHKCVDLSVKLEEKWNEFLTLIHAVHCCHHGPPGHQIESSNTIDGEHCAIWVPVCHHLHHVCDALAPCSGRECVLGGLGGTSNLVMYWFARVFATNLLMTSPTTIPRIPPFAFCNAVIWPILKAETISSGSFACAKAWEISKNLVQSSTLSRSGRKCSLRMPEGPPAAPRRPVRKLWRNSACQSVQSLFSPRCNRGSLKRVAGR